MSPRVLSTITSRARKDWVCTGDEVIADITREKWLEPLRGATDPLDALSKIFQSTSLRDEDVILGCPLNNLSQEMSPLDEGFRKRLARVFAIWHGAIAGALRDGQKRGQVKKISMLMKRLPF